MKFGAVLLCGLVIAGADVALAQRAAPAKAAPAAGPTLVMEMAKGTIEIELFTKDAPKSTAHILMLVRKNFYRGLRFHRVESSLVQIGDPGTRSYANEASWGSYSYGEPIGVSEIPKGRLHVRGAVGLAYPTGADGRLSDSQFYIMKTASPSLNGKYAVIGHVTKGMEVVDKIARGDAVKNAYVKGEGPK